MGKMYKKKQDEKHGSRREHINKQEDEMDIRKIMKDVENFSNSHMTWKERKKIEDRKVVSLGGKPLKNQRLPLSVARPMMKKQKQREEKMLQERMILGRFGGKIGGSSSSSKKSTGKHKPEDRGLKLSEGRFRNGILDVKHLLKSTPTRGNDTGKNMSNTGKRQGGNWKHDKRGGGKKHEMF
ncbi:axoneme-associated protein MST101(2) protein [Trifolium repens]|nr:axoneme-associated protein MST101(2) protein [Trifolium repens]